MARLESRLALLAVQVRAALAAELDNSLEIERWRTEARQIEFRCYVLRYKLFGSVPVVRALTAVAGGKRDDQGEADGTPKATAGAES